MTTLALIVFWGTRALFILFFAGSLIAFLYGAFVKKDPMAIIIISIIFGIALFVGIMILNDWATSYLGM